jgi:hypothetical protein
MRKKHTREWLSKALQSCQAIRLAISDENGYRRIRGWQDIMILTINNSTSSFKIKLISGCLGTATPRRHLSAIATPSLWPHTQMNTNNFRLISIAVAFIMRKTHVHIINSFRKLKFPKSILEIPQDFYSDSWLLSPPFSSGYPLWSAL